MAKKIRLSLKYLFERVNDIAHDLVSLQQRIDGMDHRKKYFDESKNNFDVRLRSLERQVERLVQKVALVEDGESQLAEDSDKQERREYREVMRMQAEALALLVENAKKK